ncbi:sulfatase, partial [Singulisphaera rosea]
LDAKFPTLAEALGRRGYRTGGFVSNTVFCTTEYGLSRGFSHYEDYVITPLEILRTSALGGLVCHRLGTLLDRIYPAVGLAPRHPLEVEQYRKTASKVNRDALRWIASERGRPFFAFLNYMDAHDPYLLPPDARRHFGVQPKTLADYQTLRGWIAEERWVPNASQVTLARDAYDDCVAYLDDQLGHLFQELEALGALENTVVIVTADHGEHFGEHQLEGKPVFGHRATLYQPEIHVPLLVISPGKVPAGRVVPGPVSMRDLPATVLDLLGPDPRTAADFPGTSLARTWRPGNGESNGTADPVESEFAFNTKLPPLLRYAVPSEGLRRALISEGTVYHRIGQTLEELFDLEKDPGEARNLAKAPEFQQRLGESRQELNRLIPPAKVQSGARR